MGKLSSFCRRVIPKESIDNGKTFKKGRLRRIAPCGARIKKGELALHKKYCLDPLCKEERH